MKKFVRKHFKSTQNPYQISSVRFTVNLVYVGGVPKDIEVKKNVEIIKKIPKKNKEDFSEKFINWFVDFRSNEYLHLQEIALYPKWLQKMILLKIQEKHHKYEFKAWLKTLEEKA